jgi:hypothetical protein
MAYISPEQVKTIRKQIRTKYPKRDGWKISVRGRDYMCVDVSILEAPRDLGCGDYDQINHYNLGELKEKDLFEDITRIAMNGNHDRSDAMTDYFDVGWYFNLSVGDWDKPFAVKIPKHITDRMDEQMNEIIALGTC